MIMIKKHARRQIVLRLRRTFPTLAGSTMNAKLLFKTIFLIAILLLLVIMGMNNRDTVELSLPPLIPKTQKMPAAIMYFGFFGVGVLTGTILTAGGKRGGSRTKSA